MGVRGLETFIKTQVPNGTFNVNIFDAIEAFKSNNPGAKVVLIFDLCGLLHGVFERFDPIERFCGGNYKMLHDVFEAFFLKLTDAGAKLVFFHDGPVHDSKYQTWCDRRNEDYREYCSIFDVVDSNMSLNMIANFCFERLHFTPSMNVAIYDLIQLTKRFGMYRVAIDAECDSEIAKYAIENDALAVIGNDSDYMIYEGYWRYWSAKDLDLINKNWNTMEFNKQALRKYLDLNMKQMILFSVISGNDVIPYKRLKRLHKKIHRNDENNNDYDYNKYHFLDISKYVKCFSNNLTCDEIITLSLEIFSSPSEENLLLINDTIRFYDTEIRSAIISPLLSNAAVHNGGLYSILAGEPYSFSLPFYDLRRNDFLPFHRIVFPLLARQVGLIRQHLNNPSYLQIVETKIRHDESYIAINLYPDYPPMLVPNLMEFIFNENDRRYQGLRFILLKWLIFDDVQSTLEIDQIPHRYMVTILTLMYLLRKLDGNKLIHQYTCLDSEMLLAGWTELVRFLHLLNALKSITKHTQAYNEAIDNIRFYRSFFCQIPPKCVETIRVDRQIDLI